MTDETLKWRTADTLPDGWYWWRASKTGPIKPREVTGGEVIGLVKVKRADGQPAYQVGMARDFSGQWYGPIEEPGE